MCTHLENAHNSETCMYNVNTHFPDLPRSKVDFLRFVQRLRTFRESTSDAIVIHCRLVGGNTHFGCLVIEPSV